MACIYKITNIVNNKIYIGSTHKTLNKRKSEHLAQLRGNYHKNKHLQAAFNKYLESSFLFEVIEECEIPSSFTNDERYKYLTDKELYYINSLDPQYNFCKETKAGKLGRIVTEEQKLHMRELMLGKTHSEESKQKIRKARAKQVITEEHKRNISESMKGKNTWTIGSKQSLNQKEKASTVLFIHYINKTGIFDPEVQKKRIEKMKQITASKIKN
jgi:group I intron endonuclease